MSWKFYQNIITETLIMTERIVFKNCTNLTHFSHIGPLITDNTDEEDGTN